MPRKKKLKAEYREAEIMCAKCGLKLGQFGVEADARLEMIVLLCTVCSKVTLARDPVELLLDSQLFSAEGPKRPEPVKNA